MELTDKNRETIDNKSYEQLLYGVRFSPIGDPWFQGETGDYWMKRMQSLRSEEGGQQEHINASKSIGWD